MWPVGTLVFSPAYVVGDRMPPRPGPGPVSVRFSPEELTTLRARLGGRSLSAWLREAALMAGDERHALLARLDAVRGRVDLEALRALVEAAE